MARDPVTRVTLDDPENRRPDGDHESGGHDPVTRMTPIGSGRRVTEELPNDRSVGGSARPPEAGRSPAAFDDSAEEEVITACKQVPGSRGRSLRLADRLALRPKEAAKALGISERTLRRWMRELDLPYARLDGVILIPRAKLERWIEDHLTTEGKTERILTEIMADL